MLALEIAGVVKQAATAPQDAEQVPIELARVQVARQTPGGRIVDDARKTLVVQRANLFRRVADPLRDRRIMEQGRRPRIKPGDLQDPWIELTGQQAVGG